MKPVPERGRTACRSQTAAVLPSSAPEPCPVRHPTLVPPFGLPFKVTQFTKSFLPASLTKSSRNSPRQPNPGAPTRSHQGQPQPRGRAGGAAALRAVGRAPARPCGSGSQRGAAPGLNTTGTRPLSRAVQGQAAPGADSARDGAAAPEPAGAERPTGRHVLEQPATILGRDGGNDRAQDETRLGEARPTAHHGPARPFHRQSHLRTSRCNTRSGARLPLATGPSSYSPWFGAPGQTGNVSGQHRNSGSPHRAHLI